MSLFFFTHSYQHFGCENKTSELISHELQISFIFTETPYL